VWAQAPVNLDSSRGQTFHSTFAYLHFTDDDEPEKSAASHPTHHGRADHVERECFISDLLRVAAILHEMTRIGRGVGWRNLPQALAGRLRRAQTALRALGIEMTFGSGASGDAHHPAEGIARKATLATVSTVSTVGTVGKGID
jgi:hypothetical protein